MARLDMLLVFLVVECIAANYIRPNRPFFNNFDIPQPQFDERTSLAEMKRMFESIDQMSSRSYVPRDLLADGPVAWYQPEEDEPFYDDGKCADKFSRCQVFVDNKQCYEEKFKKWMQAKCRKTCGFCEENCMDSKYGCCPDRKTPADGPYKAGCGIKLCIDLRDCTNVKTKCDKPGATALKTWLRNNCAYTCRLCKAPSPQGDCEARKPLYGCCWNGQEATGWNGQGCLPCEDTYPRACQLFPQCDSPFYNMRTFVDQSCPKSCGRCGACFDKQESSKCERWEQQGLCKSSGGWKNYMAENCAKTCGLCESSGNNGVRSLMELFHGK